MKKFIALFTLFLAFTISANAQEKKVSNEEAAENDITALISKVTIDPTLKKDLYTLMLMKHQTLSNPKISKEEKANASKAYERKIMSGLNDSQRKELLQYPELIKQLTN